MNIPNGIRKAAGHIPALYEMSTGGGCDYIVLSIDRTTDLILCDTEDSGSPGFNDDPVLYFEVEKPLDSPACLMLQISDWDEPHAWNAGGSAIIFKGTVAQCLRHMSDIADLNNIKSEPDY